MLELAIKGSKKYYAWVALLLVIIGIGFLVYLKQLSFGLALTGLSRDVSWGFYIANLTFLVGVAAGGVMVVLPYYLHHCCHCHVHHICCGRPGAALAGVQYPLVSLPRLSTILGYCCSAGISFPESYYRLECPGS